MDSLNDREESIKIANDEVTLLMKKIKFDFSVKRNTYIKETLISNYLDNLFNSLNNVEEYWNSTKKEVMEYIDNFINIPLPKMTLTNLDLIDSIKCIINTDNDVKVYSDKETNKVATTFKKGDFVNVLEYKSNNEYAKIKLNNGDIAYIEKNSISLV